MSNFRSPPPFQDSLAFCTFVSRRIRVGQRGRHWEGGGESVITLLSPHPASPAVPGLSSITVVLEQKRISSLV